MLNDPGVADTLGLALIGKGLYASAISELTDAAEKMPQNPAVLYHLALAHWKSGEKGQAVEALHDALKIKDSFPERQAVTKLLEGAQSSKKGKINHWKLSLSVSIELSVLSFHRANARYEKRKAKLPGNIVDSYLNVVFFQ